MHVVRKQIVWLLNKSQKDLKLQLSKDASSLRQQIKDDDIQLFVFERFYQFKDFLNNIFRLKPELMSWKAHDYFRIVVQDSQNDRNEESSIDAVSVAQVLEFMKEICANTPVFIYTNQEFHDMKRMSYQQANFQIIQLYRRLYPFYFADTNKLIARNYCKFNPIKFGLSQFERPENQATDNQQVSINQYDQVQ